ncbi:hypothetical protein ABPG72_021718 [Tetrahymena utriculariae]
MSQPKINNSALHQKISQSAQKCHPSTNQSGAFQKSVQKSKNNSSQTNITVSKTQSLLNQDGKNKQNSKQSSHKIKKQTTDSKGNNSFSEVLKSSTLPSQQKSTSSSTQQQNKSKKSNRIHSSSEDQNRNESLFKDTFDILKGLYEFQKLTGSLVKEQVGLIKELTGIVKDIVQENEAYHQEFAFKQDKILKYLQEKETYQVSMQSLLEALQNNFLQTNYININL